MNPPRVSLRPSTRRKSRPPTSRLGIAAAYGLRHRRYEARTCIMKYPLARDGSAGRVSGTSPARRVSDVATWADWSLAGGLVRLADARAPAWSRFGVPGVGGWRHRRSSAAVTLTGRCSQPRQQHSPLFRRLSPMCVNPARRFAPTSSTRLNRSAQQHVDGRAAAAGQAGLFMADSSCALRLSNGRHLGPPQGVSGAAA